MNRAEDKGGFDTPRSAMSWDARTELLRQKIERNRRLFEEQELGTLQRDKEIAERLTIEFFQDGRL